MPSPFPGIDPYLEHPRAWPNIHHRLMTAIADDIAPKLLPKYQVLIEERLYQVDGQDSIVVGVPDVAVAQGQRQSTQSTVALATVSRPSDAVTVTLTIPETIRQGYLEIREIATSQVITVVEVLSPTNKRPGRGRMEYETKRATLLGSLCNFVEIDLLRQWPPLVIPQGIEPSAYRILVSPQELRPQASWYGFNLADPIPLFELPLQSGDQIPVVDLKGLLDGIYDRSGYGLVIDYAHNGLQCVMFTHQDTGVWADMVSIFWAAGLQVVSAWYIDTETSSELRQGAYVQGTVTMLLRKRLRTVSTFKQRLLPLIRKEVTAQIEAMMNLNDTAQVHGETVFNDSDLQMAGYAAALKVLTQYTEVDGRDVTNLALQPRQKGQATVVDDIVEYASEVANNLLIPERLKELNPDTWSEITGVERFYLRMLAIEKTGATKLDNYQNFSKAFGVNYQPLMASLEANKARLKGAKELKPRDLASGDLGGTLLSEILMAIQELLADKDPKVVIGQIRTSLGDTYFSKRNHLVAMAHYIAEMWAEKRPDEAQKADIIGSRIRNEGI